MNFSELAKDIKQHNLKIGLAVEGGGLRGVVSATLLQLFEQFELQSHVKAISGTSAGALNAAYFLNNNMQLALDLYKHIASHEFIQLRNWPNTMNLDFLFESIKQRFPIQWSSLREHPIPFHISMTNIQTGFGEFRLAQNCLSDTELCQALRASASAPLFTTNQEKLGDSFYNDGHVNLAIPTSCFNLDDFDLVICLLTQKKGYRKKEGFKDYLLRKANLRHYNSQYQESFKNSYNLYNEQLNDIYQHNKFIALAAEDPTFMISKSCTNPTHIQKCINSVRAQFL